MADKCILITAVPDRYKEWYSSVEKDFREQGKPATKEQIEAIWTNHIAKNDNSDLMAYIVHPDRGARTAIQFNGSKPKETLVLGTKLNADGTVTVATTDGTYTFKDGSSTSVKTAKGVSVEMPIMQDIITQAEMASISGFNSPFNVMSREANAWASKYLLVGLAEKSGKVIGPLITKAHVAAKKKSNLYRDTVNLIDKGVRDSEFLAKMKVLLKIGGDIDDKVLAKAITIAYNNARRTKEVLDTQLPALDKWINKDVRDIKDRKNLNYIFGRSGFINLFDNKDITAELNNGTTIDKLISMVPHTKKQLEEAQELSEYMSKGKVGTRGLYNSDSKTVQQLATLLVLREDGRFETLNKVRTKNPELYVELLRLTGMVKSLHEVAYKGKRNTVGQGSGKVYQGYDGHGMMDVYEGTHEYKQVDKVQMEEVMELDPRWKIVREPTENNFGLLYRDSLNSNQEGLGLDKDIIRNGVGLDSKYVEAMISQHGIGWLTENNVVSDVDNGYTRYRTVLRDTERENAGYLENIAHTLYRTWVHDAQLVEMQTVQAIIVNEMTASGEGAAKEVEDIIKGNLKVSADKREEVKPFLKLDMKYDEMKKLYPELAKRYTPLKNISNYGDIKEKANYVRKDMEDVLVGYSIGSIFKDDSTFGITLQRAETVYKQLVQMIKLKMVVANPAKLAMDTVSNTTLLLSLDVGIDEIAKGFPEAVVYAKQMSELESRLVSAKLKLAQAEAVGEDTKKYQREVTIVNKLIERHPFNPAIANGFIQSQGTSMLVKEYDTISGLQKTIDDVVKLVVQDKKGNPNKMHDGLVGLMNLGFGVDDILSSISQMSKVKGTTIGTELEGIADRLAAKKGKDVIKAEEKRLGRALTAEELKEIQKDADTVRYVSEFIAAPSSELVRQGSRVMQMADVMSRWTLYKHEMGKNLKSIGYEYVSDYKAKQDISAGRLDSKEYERINGDAAVKALDTFIDYRLNLPKELQTLSNLGVIMFPSFWIRAQKVIYNLVKYHPVNAGVGLLLTDLLGMSGASIIDANILNKFGEGTLLQAGQDVLQAKTLILGL